MQHKKTKRVTLRLDTHVLGDAKQLAAKREMTLSDFVEETLRIKVLSSRQPHEAIELPTFHGGGPLPGVDINNNAALLALLDEGLPIEKLR